MPIYVPDIYTRDHIIAVSINLNKNADQPQLHYHIKCP